MSTNNASYWISRLGLNPHPEGGFFKEVFRSGQELSRPSSTVLKRACTSIYYLLEGNDYSGFHRLASDEIWYFHKGEPLHIYVFDQQGSLNIHELSEKASGNFSVVVEAGLWFAAAIPAGSGFSLVSCAVAPGFEFGEFEMADKKELTRLFPVHKAVIDRFCR